MGTAVAKNSILAEHTAFLNAGGAGFRLGDGSLPNCKYENLLAIVYKARLAHSLYLASDDQLIQYPGYKDRELANPFVLRIHVEF